MNASGSWRTGAGIMWAAQGWKGVCGFALVRLPVAGVSIAMTLIGRAIRTDGH